MKRRELITGVGAVAVAAGSAKAASREAFDAKAFIAARPIRAGLLTHIIILDLYHPVSPEIVEDLATEGYDLVTQTPVPPLYRSYYRRVL